MKKMSFVEESSMNREILFRGKRIDGGEWVEGSLVIWADKTMSIETGCTSSPMFSVDPDTVGQYSGLTDKNGNMVFEGDVMEFVAYGFHYKGVVSFVNGNFCVICNHPDASPFLDDVIKRHGAYVIDVQDKPDFTEEEKCVCREYGLEKGDTLYISTSWDGGIGFDYIHHIKFCPVCGKELPGWWK